MASSLRGFNWAIQSIKQMMPVQIYADVPSFDVEWFLPCCSINDAPRFPYRDYYQSPDKDNEPLACGWCVPVERCYSFEPFIEGMTEEEKSYILGVQANLWTEYIETQEHLEYMLLPRMTALSEVQWCLPENKSWKRFLTNVKKICSIYDIAGYNYARHIFK